MRAKTAILALMISLSVLMALPSELSVSRVFGVSQSGNTRWSPFGPHEQNMIITVYGDFQAMFNAFATGQVDITDWPLQPANLGTGSSAAYCDNTFNPDFFCTTPTGELGIFDQQINSWTPIMGHALTQSRTPVAASITTGTNTTACDSSHDSYTITLHNQESGNNVLDAFNTLTVANQPSGSPTSTVADSGGSTPNGVYNVPCLIAGTYKVSSSIYGGTALVKTSGGKNHALTFNVNWNSISSVSPTAARSLWGAAQGHMLDVPGFVNDFFGSAATYDNIMAPPAQGLTQPTPAQLTAADCNTGGVANLHAWASACNGGSPDVSAYNLVADNGISGGTLWWQVTGTGITPGKGYSGHDDIRAACDDLVALGLSLGGPSASCANVANALGNATLTGTGWTSSSYPHVVPVGNIIYYIRTSLARKRFGTIIADTLNAMFGTPSSSGGGTVCYGACPNSAPAYYTIGQVATPIFGDGPISAGGNGPNGWQLYTGGFSLSSTPDHLYGLFNSVFTGGTCGTGSTASAQPNNYVFFCNPQFDTDSAAGEFSTATTYGPLFSRAALDGMNSAMDIPVYSAVASFAELNGWNYQQCTGSPCANTQSSLVNTLGLGTQAPFQTTLNARQVPGFTPVNSIYAPGGRSGTTDNGILRYGWSQSTTQLSPFQFTTVWEANVVFEVYDSMLALNPLQSAASGQLIDWQTTTHTSTFSPTQTCTSPGTGTVLGCTTQIWHLRNDLKFQDGNPVTANDVAYSIQAYRDVPSANLGPSVANVANGTLNPKGTDCGSGQACKTLQVTLALQSPFYELNIGGLPILEKALWAPFCGDPALSSSVCASLAFDPMTANNALTSTPGIFVGDGPFSCVVPTGFPNAGHVGGSCTESAGNVLEGQFVDTGGRILLTKNSLYVRCCADGAGATGSSLYKISYADKNNDGIVNIQDLADAAFHFGTADAYWVNPNIAPGTTVNIQDLATVAFYFGAGVTSYGGSSNLSTLTGIDPQIDPFNCAITGC